MKRGKVPNSEKPSRGDFQSYWPHTEIETYLPHRRYLGSATLCGIDPGIDHFGVGIRRYYPDGSSETLFLDHWSFTDFVKRNGIEAVLFKMEENFQALDFLMQQCDQIHIEDQSQSYYGSIRVMEHLATWFRCHYANNEQRTGIYITSAKLKGRQMGAPPHQTSAGLKKWSRQAGYEYVYNAGDRFACQVVLSELNNGKGDEDTDVILMLAAVVKKYEICSRIEPLALTLAETRGWSLRLPFSTINWNEVDVPVETSQATGSAVNLSLETETKLVLAD